MKLLADFHTHSKNSRLGHGKNKIEEMAISANEMGLVEIGVTDHGYAHFFRTTKQKMVQARKIVDEINEWSKTKVLLGIEADIISEDGTLDVDNETLALVDILIIGYHRLIFTDFANFFGKAKKTEEAKRKCTNAFVNAIRRYPVTIVAHLDSILNTDMYEIGRACYERGTMIEINNRHTKWTEKQVEDLIASECMFVLSSDAHSREAVGEVSKAMDLVRKYNIPSERIANVEFAEDEKSELDRAFSAYKSIYEQLDRNQEIKEKEADKKRKTEITGKLSNEMESALEKIAKEKGLDYQAYKPQQETIGTEHVSKMSKDDMDLIAKAEEYIRNNKMQQIAEENKNIVIEETQPMLDEHLEIDDEHPLVTGFERNFQSINSIIKEESAGKNNENGVKAIDLVNRNEENSEKDLEANSRELHDFEIEEDYSSASVMEQLNSSNTNEVKMRGLKNLINSVTTKEPEENPIKKDEQKITIAKKVEPENFMQSITQKNLGKVSEAEEIKDVQTQKKPFAKGNKRGGFIVVNDLIDDDKK